MSTLYEIEGDLRALLDALNDETMPAEDRDAAIDAFLTDAAAEKLDGYCTVIADRQARAEARKREAMRLSDLARADENTAARLRARLASFLATSGRKRIDTERFKLILQAGRWSVHVEPDAEIPDDLLRVTTAPDKLALMEALKAGREFRGVALVQGGPSLLIR